MASRTLRPRDPEDVRSRAKGKAKATPVKSEQAKAPRRKSEPLYENELDIDPWLESSDWSRLFSEATLAAVKASKSREEWEVKVTFCIGQMGLHMRHVPGHRVPEVMGCFQPTASGVVHAAGERPFFEKKLKELQSELAAGFETVSRMFLGTQAGKEYVDGFWKAKVQKHKPKWATPEVIDNGITITEVEVCALWTPISIACGSGWFLEDSLKAKMVSFVPIMKKQTYWILARFIRALIMTKDTNMDLSVETRQDIFLYSSKMDLFPGFPSPNGGYPRSTEEWMCVSPYYKSALETDELKTFMKRYDYMTAAMREEERVRASKEARKEQARKERELEKEDEREKEGQLQLEASEANGRLSENAELICIDAVTEVASDNDKVTNQEMGVAEVTIDIVGPVPEAEASVVSVEKTVVKMEASQEKMMPSEYAISSDADETTSGTCSTSTDDSEDLSSDDDIDAVEISTTMAIEATTAMEEDDFRQCDEEEEIFKQKVEEVKEVLELAGVKNWKEETLHSLMLSGPIGLSVWASRSLGKLRHEIQRATVMLKQVDQGISVAQNQLKEDREQAKRDLQVWKQVQAEVYAKMDGLVSMRHEDLKAKTVATGGNQSSGGGFLGFGGRGEGSTGKRRSVYVDGVKKKKKVKSVNPFETPGKAVTPGTPSERSETLN